MGLCIFRSLNWPFPSFCVLKTRNDGTSQFKLQKLQFLVTFGFSGNPTPHRSGYWRLWHPTRDPTGTKNSLFEIDPIPTLSGQMSLRTRTSSDRKHACRGPSWTVQSPCWEFANCSGCSKCASSYEVPEVQLNLLLNEEELEGVWKAYLKQPRKEISLEILF